MRVWSISNQKGGVGKTTTVASLAGGLVARGESTLVVDLDPHGSLTSYFGLLPESVTQGSYDLFREAMARRHPDPKRCIQQTSVKGLDILPAVMALATIERQAGAFEGLGLVIKRALNHLSHDYDTVLIDSPPMLGVLMVNALAACDRLIIPVMTDFLSLRGLDRMLRTLEMISHSRAQPHHYVIVPTLYDRRPRVSRDTLKILEERFDGFLWPGVIPLDTKVREASQVHLPVSLYRPRSRAAIAYDSLLSCLLEYRSNKATEALSA